MIGFGKRISYAFKTFFGILSGGEIPREVAQELIQPAAGLVARSPKAIEEPPPAPPVESSDRAVQMLAILQRDGRLIDFLTEDISPYSDEQIGAAVRDLHQSCKQTLERYVRLEPVIDSEEGQHITVQETVDPAAIKLIGNVTGKPPLTGLLRHRGWRVSAVNLPPLPDGAGRTVVAPAEVEIP
ncbi:MAG: DUF2760 domain-containing protein [Blastocatellia bacterium]